MEVIVLAGGLGTRLQPIVPDLPKPMAPVAGRPFLEILLTWLARKGFHRVVLSLGHMADKVVAHFGSAFGGMDLAYEIEGQPLGTGGAIRQALFHCREDHVFVVNGDTYLDLEVSRVEAHWQSRRFPIITARSVPDTARYGRLVVDEGRLLGFGEKGLSGPGLINAGYYLLPADVFGGCTLGRKFSLETDFLVQAVGARRFDVFVSDGTFIDIGVPEDYARAQVELAGISP